MKDRIEPCIYYVCHGADCQKGYKNVDMSKCKNCKKYRGRKNNHKKESVKYQRQKDKDKHDRYEY